MNGAVKPTLDVYAFMKRDGNDGAVALGTALPAIITAVVARHLRPGPVASCARAAVGGVLSPTMP